MAAVVDANTVGSTPQDLLDGFKPALLVPVAVALLGVLAMTHGTRTRSVAVAESEVDLAEAA